MRIISGKKRGMNLYTLDGANTRPTLDRVKETMFNVLNLDIVGKNCLDVFAGSGNLSIEALSRGALYAYLIESNNNANIVIKKNIEKAQLEEQTTLIKADFRDALKNLAMSERKFSIVFLDPPYNADFYYEALDILVKGGLLNEDAIIVCEHSKNMEINHSNFYVWKIKTFSKNAVSFLKIYYGDDDDDFSFLI